LPLRLVRFLAKYERSERLARFLNNLNWQSDKDLFSRYASFLRQGTNVRQEDVFRALMDFYPEDTRFVILTMDMEHMYAGPPIKNFIQQLDEIVNLLPSFRDKMYPFIFAHPERDNILDLVKKYIDKGFRGIKIYPPLGYFPFNPELHDVFKYAEDHQIPVMTHCSRGGVYTRKKLSRLQQIHPKTGKKLEGRNRKEFTDNFTDPDNFEYLLQEFPNLKICFGHFGGMDELQKFQDSTTREVWENSWFSKIKGLLKKYPNTYADVSYTFSDLSLVPLLNITLLSNDYHNKILFGSDFYMANIEGNEYRFSVYLRNELGEANFKQIAEINPLRYLGI